MRKWSGFGLFLVGSLVAGIVIPNLSFAHGNVDLAALNPKDGLLCHGAEEAGGTVWYVSYGEHGSNELMRAVLGQAPVRIMTLVEQAWSLEHKFYTGGLNNPRTMHPLVVAAFYSHEKSAMLDIYPGDEPFDASLAGNFKKDYFTDGPVLLQCCSILAKAPEGVSSCPAAWH